MKLIFEIPVIVHDDKDDSEEDYTGFDSDAVYFKEETADGFNSDDVAGYMHYHVKNIIGAHAYVENNKLFIAIESTKFNSTILKKITDELNGQLSDGWGEGFEQWPITYEGEEYYISTWSHDQSAKFIKVETVNDN